MPSWRRRRSPSGSRNIDARWSSEVKTIAMEVRKPMQLSATIKDAADKVKKRNANKPGLQIPGKTELVMEIRLFQGEEILGGDPSANAGVLDRITLVDSSGVLARYDKKSGKFELPP
jgi:hypothetical protein